MPGWDANLYLKFSGQRARPATDLIAQIELENPRRVIDLGCGSGNSTEQLRRRWPQADLTGLDNSPDMLKQARNNHPDWKWIQSGVEEWAPESTFDLIFSNACLHWVADHARLFPRLLSYLAQGGALAVQMPNSYHLAAHTIMQEVANDPSAPWSHTLAGAAETYSVQPAAFYYDTLRKLSSRINVWQTEYLQIMDGPRAILDWVRGTAMRRFTEPLPSDEQRTQFEQRCLERFERSYRANDQGKTLFPYRRIFVIVYR
ncbi:MAG TPA: methyltransferase domain-containing protein [Terriglobales bacterium]